jgi:hypothetical protein
MLTLATYTDRLELIDIQYGLIRFAIGKLSASQRHSFFSHLKAEWMSVVQRALDSALAACRNKHVLKCTCCFCWPIRMLFACERIISTGC